MARRLRQDISIGKNLRALRKRNELTQDQVVAKLQVQDIPISREILSQMERGRYSIRISVLLALKDLYKASSFDEFFSNLENPRREK
jgi:transcriptional regulator with XRE-family HTH domain